MNKEKCKVCGVETILDSKGLCSSCWEDIYSENSRELEMDCEEEW